MKIGIVSLPDSSNCGAYLQAYCMKTALEDLGHEVIFYRTRPQEYIKDLFFRFSLQGLIRHPIRESARLRFERARYRSYQKDWEAFRFVPPSEGVDLALLGSDVIWNIGSESYRRPILFGSGLDAKRMTAFSVSVGGMTEFEDFEVHPDLMEAVKRIPTVSVRDQKSKEIVGRIRGEDVPITCDPTFLVDIQSRLPAAGCQKAGDRPYLFVYSYSVDPKTQENIRRFAKEHGLLTVGGGLYHSWCDRNVPCSPLQFVTLLKNAQYVYTTTFHGSIFSILLEKPFAVQIKTPKVRDLLSRQFSLEKVVLEDDAGYEAFCGCLEQPLFAVADCRRRIAEMREQSLTHLKCVLAGEGESNG